MLCIILEQGVCPSRALAFLVDGVRRGSGRAAPDGAAAGGVGDHHVVAEKLGHEAGVAGLGTARAGAGELKVGLLELAADNGVILDLGLLADLGYHVVEYGLLVSLTIKACHLEGLGGADAYADAAAHAVHGGDGHGVLVKTLALAGAEVNDLSIRGSRSGFFLGKREGTDGGVGAYKRTLVALRAGLAVPLRNKCGHAALFVGGSAELEGAVGVADEGGNGEGVAVHPAHGVENGLYHINSLLAAGHDGCPGLVLGLGPVCRYLDLDESRCAGVYCVVVHIDNVLSLLQIGCRRLLLHVLYRLVLRDDLRQSEERRLENGVGALAHAYLLGKVDGVYHVKLDVVLGYVALGRSVKMLLQLLKAPLTVDEEHAAGLYVAHDGEALGDVSGNMAGNKVCLVDVVGTLYGLVAEAQMADGNAARLLRVVLEVRLNVLVGVVADDLDGVLVRADRAVAAQTPELALNGALGCGGGSLGLLKGEAGHVVHDADGELALHRVLLQLVVNGKHGGGGSVLGAETVAAADDLNVPAGISNGCHNVEVQRLALSAGLLGAVEHRDLPTGLGNGLKQLVGSPWTVQPYLDKTDLLALSDEVVDDLLGNVADGSHCDDDAVGVGSAVVVEELVVGAELFVYLAHVLLDYLGDGVVILVAGLAVLEEDISVLV